MGRKIICINRNCGSGGHTIGQMVAKKLGISYYDKNLLTMALEHGGLTGIRSFENVDEKAPNPAFYKLRYEGNDNVESEKPANDMVYQLQKDMILKIAEQEDCVIVGRCANAILEEAGIDHISCFVTASKQYCIDHIMKRDEINKVQAGMRVKVINKRRGEYYYHYTKQDWTKDTTYELVLNSERLGEQQCAKLLCAYYRNAM